MPESTSLKLLILLAVAGLGGCTSDGSSRNATVGDAARWQAELNTAHHRSFRPDRAAREAPPPAGATLPPLTMADSALATRADAIEHFARPVINEATAPVEAVRRYVAGRSALVRGNAAAAVRELERAVELDPVSADVLTALGEARLASGDRLAALTAFRNAFDAGSRAPGMLLLLGLQAQRESDQQSSAEYLATLLSLPDQGNDPALRPLANVSLGEALLALGHPHAARETIAAGLDLPETWTERTRFSSEMTALYRSRPILWRVVGDVSIRLGDHEGALTAYARAASILPSEAWVLLERRVLAAMRMGDPVAATLVVLEDVAEDPTRLRDRHVRLMRYITVNRSGGDAALVRAAAEAAREKVGEGLTPTLASRLVRLEASATNDRAAVELLTAHLERMPLDWEAMVDLSARLPGRASEILRRCGPIAAAEPGAAAMLSGALIERFGAPDPRVRVRSVGSRILLAAWLKEADELQAAQQVAAPLRNEVNNAAAIETYGLVAAACADWGSVQEALRLLAGPEPDQAFARGSLLSALQRFDEAVDDVMRVPAEAVSPHRALRMTRMAAQAGRADAMRDVLVRSLEQDRYMEPTYAALVEAYRAMGEASSELRRQTGARLQMLAPDGASLYLLRSRELLMGGQTAHAFSQVMELLRLFPRDPEARDLALQIAEALVRSDPSQLESALAWVGGAHHWDESWKVAAEAHLRLVAGDAEEAERQLRAAFDAKPSARLARALEIVLRETDRHAEAEEAALARLAVEPASFDNVAFRAALLARRGAIQEAVDALGSLPEGSRLLENQGLTLLSGVQPAVYAAMRSGLPDEMRGALELIRAAKRRAEATGPIHVLHVQLALALMDAQATGEAIKGLESAGLLRQFAQSIGLAHEEFSETELAAQLCYELAGLFSQRDRQTEAEWLYRLALTYEPEHAWTCNNLGYGLVERGEQIEEAERLLQIAYRQLDTEPSVIDSLGWLRYRQGMLEDAVDEATGERVAGAVSLLGDAVSKPEGANSSTLRDHYGDALWRAGRTREARNQWMLALDIASQELRQTSQADSRELSERVRQLHQKVVAAATEQSPAVAPLFPGVSPESRASTENSIGRNRQE